MHGFQKIWTCSSPQGSSWLVVLELESCLTGIWSPRWNSLTQRGCCSLRSCMARRAKVLGDPYGIPLLDYPRPPRAVAALGYRTHSADHCQPASVLGDLVELSCWHVAAVWVAGSSSSVLLWNFTKVFLIAKTPTLLFYGRFRQFTIVDLEKFRNFQRFLNLKKWKCPQKLALVKPQKWKFELGN